MCPCNHPSRGVSAHLHFLDIVASHLFTSRRAPKGQRNTHVRKFTTPDFIVQPCLDRILNFGVGWEGDGSRERNVLRSNQQLGRARRDIADVRQDRAGFPRFGRAALPGGECTKAGLGFLAHLRSACHLVNSTPESATCSPSGTVNGVRLGRTL